MYEWIFSKRNVRVNRVKLFDSCTIMDIGFKMFMGVKG